MGYVIEFKDIDSRILCNNDKAIILCNYHNEISGVFNEYHKVSLGILLSDKLIRYSKEERNKRLIEEMDSLLLNNYNDKLLIKDIDMLFNPEYKIDVLKYFINLARIKKIAVIWNGMIKNGYIQYSEDGYLDYKRYLIKNYDIICVK